MRILASALMLATAGLLSAGSALAFETDDFEAEGGPSTALGVDKLSISFFGHASLMIQFGKTVIYADPVGQYADYGKLPKADIVLVTHEHFDHLDAKAIDQVAKKATRIVINPSGRKQLGKGDALKNGKSLTIGGIKITAVPAYNTTPGRDRFHPRGRDNGYVLDAGGKRIYIAGDTEDIPEMADLKGIDIAFLPMNQPYTMTPQQLARAAAMFRPKVLYPYHTGDTDLSGVPELLKGLSGVELRIRSLK